MSRGTAGRRTTTVPGPVRRLLRNRVKLAAIGLVVAAGLSTATINLGAAAALRGTLDSNWRGAYDVLVTAEGTGSPLRGMLPPNASHAGSENLSLDDVARVRDVAGVELAAPIGELLVPGFRPVSPQLLIPRSAFDADTPQAFRLEVEYTSDDGFGERVVHTETHEFVSDETLPEPVVRGCDPGAVLTWMDDDVDAQQYPAFAAHVCAMNTQVDDGPGIFTSDEHGWKRDGAEGSIYSVSLGAAPVSTSRITLVDPEAERALLGERGAFLDPLRALGEAGAGAAPGGTARGATLEAWARAEVGEFAERYLDRYLRRASVGLWADPAIDADYTRFMADHGVDVFAEQQKSLAEQRLLPVLVADLATSPLAVKVSVHRIGEAQRTASADFPYETVDNAQPHEIATIGADISRALNPFLDAKVDLLWPGMTSDDNPSSWVFQTAALTEYGVAAGASYTSSASGFTLVPHGYRDPLPVTDAEGLPAPYAIDADPTAIGSEAAYVSWMPDTVAFHGTSESFQAIPVGDFRPETVTSTEQLNYVPLGAYASVGSHLTSGEFAGTQLAPSVSGLGLVSPRTTAIAPIAAATDLGLDHVVTAIRVRVADIHGYSQEAQARVLDVAERIRHLGYTATVVAGASPSDVQVTIAGYAFGTADAHGTQRVGEIGEIRQQWSELGAAARAELALSSASSAVVLIGMGAAVLLFVVVQLTGIPGHRTRASVMRELGFTRARIARWAAGEELPGLLLISAVLAVGASITASALSLLVLLGTGVVILTCTVVSVLAGARPATARAPRLGRTRSRRLGARTVRGFGLRQATLNPLTSGTQQLAIVVVAIAAAALASVLLHGRAEAGASLLAAYLSDQQFVPQLVLGVGALLAGVLLAALSRRMELQRRERQWSALRTAGWTARDVLRAQRAEASAVVIPAAIVALGAVIAGALTLDAGNPFVLVASAVCAAATATIVVVSTRMKGARA